MKIAMLGARNFPAAHGGLEIAVEEIATRVATRGHEVHVYVSHGGVGNFPPSLHIHSSPSLRFKYTHTVSQVLHAVSSIRAESFDVVHVHGVGPAFPLSLARTVFGRRARVVVTSHGHDWDRDKWHPIGQAVFRRVALSALRRADAVTAVSTSTARDLREWLELDVAAVQNGLKLPAFDQTTADTPTYSITSSRLTPEKNLAVILEAYDDTVMRLRGPLLVVGGGASSYGAPYEARLREAAPAHVKFVGSVPHDEALRLVAGAKLYVSASRLEAHPLSVIEAQALGVPLVLSDIEAHREIAGPHASYFDPESPAALREQLLSDQMNAPVSPRPTLTWDEVTDQYLQIYVRLRGLG